MNEPDDDKYEDFVPRVRPDRRGSRPRTKERPAHDDAEPGFVIGVDRGRYRVVLDDGGPHQRAVTCTRARELRRQAIVIGDVVDCVGDTTGEEGSLARIVRIHPRKTVLRRSGDDTEGQPYATFSACRPESEVSPAPSQSAARSAAETPFPGQSRTQTRPSRRGVAAGIRDPTEVLPRSEAARPSQRVKETPKGRRNPRWCQNVAARSFIPHLRNDMFKSGFRIF